MKNMSAQSSAPCRMPCYYISYPNGRQLLPIIWCNVINSEKDGSSFLEEIQSKDCHIYVTPRASQITWYLQMNKILHISFLFPDLCSKFEWCTLALAHINRSLVQICVWPLAEPSLSIAFGIKLMVFSMLEKCLCIISKIEIGLIKMSKTYVFVVCCYFRSIQDNYGQTGSFGLAQMDA